MNNKLQTSQQELLSNFPCSNQPFMIPGPCGQIEVLASCPDAPDRTRVMHVMIVLHPHPLHSGTMQNKVVHYLAKTANLMGLKALRFNFRGVGGSDGEYADGIGETEDLVAVVDWVRGQIPGCIIWLAGFSFGGYVGIRAADRVGAERLITVAPAIKFFEHSPVEPPTCFWLLIQGLKDEVVSAEDILDWSKTLSRPPEIVAVKEAGHFFHGHLNVLRDTLIQYLD